MHRLPSKAVLRKFKTASLLMVLSVLSLPIALGLLGYGLMASQQQWIYMSGWCAGVGVLFLVLGSLVAAYLRCPLCLVSPLQDRSCVKHKNAIKSFGSYRLKVAQSILLQNKFKCPYCGERTAIEVRRRSY